MLDLKRRGYNIRRFINQLESWIIKSLKTIDIESHTNQDKIGIWVSKKGGPKLSEEKIASIGLRIRKGIKSCKLSNLLYKIIWARLGSALKFEISDKPRDLIAILTISFSEIAKDEFCLVR